LTSESDPRLSVDVPDEITDLQWLQSLTFRKSAPAALRQAARAGDAQGFCQALPAAFEEQCRIGKRERSRLLAALETLWNPAGNPRKSGALQNCLLDRDLNRDELSGRVEAIMASSTEAR